MANADTAKSITFQVHDTGGQGYDVLLRVVEQAASGTLVITPEAGKTQQYALTQMQTSRDGKTLTCHSSAATVTLTIEDGSPSPRLHLVARVFFPVVDATYTLSQAAQERLLAWMHSLCLPELA
jgi:hypothetical protein